MLFVAYIQKKKKRWKRKKLKFILILLYQTIYCIQHILPSNFLPQRKESIILGALIVKCNKLTLSGSAWQSVFSQMEQQNLCLRLFIAMLTHQARDLVNTEKNGHCIREPTTMICVIISWWLLSHDCFSRKQSRSLDTIS